MRLRSSWCRFVSDGALQMLTSSMLGTGYSLRYKTHSTDSPLTPRISPPPLICRGGTPYLPIDPISRV